MTRVLHSPWPVLLVVAVLLSLLFSTVWMMLSASNVQGQRASEYAPSNVQVVPGDGTLTVSWTITSRPEVSASEIRHSLRWSQVSGVWANPTTHQSPFRNDGLPLPAGATSHTITGLTNGVATGVFVRSFTGRDYSERSAKSSSWVRVKGAHTTPRSDQTLPPMATPTATHTPTPSPTPASTPTATWTPTETASPTVTPTLSPDADDNESAQDGSSNAELGSVLFPLGDAVLEPSLTSGVTEYTIRLAAKYRNYAGFYIGVNATDAGSTVKVNGQSANGVYVFIPFPPLDKSVTVEVKVTASDGVTTKTYTLTTALLPAESDSPTATPSPTPTSTPTATSTPTDTDDNEVAGALISELATGILLHPSYRPAETNYLDCLERELGTDFETFTKSLDDYSGDDVHVMDICDDEASMFATVDSVIQTELKRLSQQNEQYAEILETKRGERFTSQVGEPRFSKFVILLENQPLSDVPESRSETLRSTSQSRSASGDTTVSKNAPSTPTVVASPVSGFDWNDCLPENGQSDLDERLALATCFASAPMSFWGSEQYDDLVAVVKTGERGFSWLEPRGVGDNECSFVADVPYASCLKHDFLYNVLITAAGDTNAANIDEAWNPRNKILVDRMFLTDIKEHGCKPWGRRDPGALTLALCLVDASTGADEETKFRQLLAQIYYLGVSEIFPIVPDQQKLPTLSTAGQWPVTQQDIDDGDNDQTFKSCDVTKLDYVDSSLRGGEALAKFTTIPDCVEDNVIESVTIKVKETYVHGDPPISWQRLRTIRFPGNWVVRDHSGKENPISLPITVGNDVSRLELLSVDFRMADVVVNDGDIKIGVLRIDGRGHYPPTSINTPYTLELSQSQCDTRPDLAQNCPDTPTPVPANSTPTPTPTPISCPAGLVPTEVYEAQPDGSNWIVVCGPGPRLLLSTPVPTATPNPSQCDTRPDYPGCPDTPTPVPPTPTPRPTSTPVPTATPNLSQCDTRPDYPGCPDTPTPVPPTPTPRPTSTPVPTATPNLSQCDTRPDYPGCPDIPTPVPPTATPVPYCDRYPWAYSCRPTATPRPSTPTPRPTATPVPYCDRYPWAYSCRPTATPRPSTPTPRPTATPKPAATATPRPTPTPDYYCDTRPWDPICY